mmetsp:Transcript_34516/g.53892  ORF Transcript_34516/g.53892 Transcript_34516/m.53892 type:complete len:472 (-) Transcript_34516:737-2152(-)|eukprot:CAMPEP_0184298734 /NCGR_PEP_ID=MMETSP1049-20130417/9480_1 /TAXON_ID=77928 /ORGANISM="Proteomonas sulcata, Strain CCMP704" /LENGTH=471 /DNA_ID=CAMNT_0026608951 /DNA_START=235 /DNA_END=1650 /DNA_ORIENTATION=+
MKAQGGWQRVRGEERPRALGSRQLRTLASAVAVTLGVVGLAEFSRSRDSSGGRAELTAQVAGNGMRVLRLGAERLEAERLGDKRPVVERLSPQELAALTRKVVVAEPGRAAGVQNEQLARVESWRDDGVHRFKHHDSSTSGIGRDESSKFLQEYQDHHDDIFHGHPWEHHAARNAWGDEMGALQRLQAKAEKRLKKDTLADDRDMSVGAGGAKTASTPRTRKDDDGEDIPEETVRAEAAAMGYNTVKSYLHSDKLFHEQETARMKAASQAARREAIAKQEEMHDKRESKRLLIRHEAKLPDRPSAHSKAKVLAAPSQNSQQLTAHKEQPRPSAAGKKSILSKIGNWFDRLPAMFRSDESQQLYGGNPAHGLLPGGQFAKPYPAVDRLQTGNSAVRAQIEREIAESERESRADDQYIRVLSEGQPMGPIHQSAEVVAPRKQMVFLHGQRPQEADKMAYDSVIGVFGQSIGQS